MPHRFNSPQRVNAKCLTICASVLACGELSSNDMRISNAADFVSGSSPARQIKPDIASIRSSIESPLKVSSLELKIVVDGFAGIDTPDEFQQPRVICLHTITN